MIFNKNLNTEMLHETPIILDRKTINALERTSSVALKKIQEESHLRFLGSSSLTFEHGERENRIRIIEQVKSKTLTRAEAARTLFISAERFDRLLARYTVLGDSDMPEENITEATRRKRQREAKIPVLIEKSPSISIPLASQSLSIPDERSLPIKKRCLTSSFPSNSQNLDIDKTTSTSSLIQNEIQFPVPKSHSNSEQAPLFNRLELEALFATTIDP